MKSHNQHIGHANVYENSADMRKLSDFKSPYLALSSLELSVRAVYAISTSYALQKTCDSKEN